MKTNRLCLAAALCAGLALGFGCGKQEQAPPPKADTAKPAESAATAAQDAAAKAAATAQETAQKATDAAKDAAAQAQQAAQAQADAAKAAADKAAADANTKVQGIIDTAKKLLAESKWQEASTTLNQLTGLKLTTEQQSLVDQLKQQVQKLMQDAATKKAAGDANKAVGDLINK